VPSPTRAAALLAVTLGLGLAACLSIAAPTRAADYRFSVPSLRLDAWVRRDGRAALTYFIELQNAPGAHPIDVLDVGLPHEGYVLESMEAAMDGTTIQASIRRSTYVDVGVEVPLGDHAIPPGGRAVFAFQGDVTDMIWQDTTDRERASFQIKPTWFDPSLVEGTTHLSINVHVPPGVALEEVVWHSDRMPFTRKELTGDPPHVVASWDFPGWRLGPDNPKAGLSFPKRAVDQVRTLSPHGLFTKWLRENPLLRFGGLALVIALLGFAWWRLTAGTGCAVFLVLAAIASVALLVNPGLLLAGVPGGLVAAVVAHRAARRRKARYLPAKASVEGGGIKRGLTAPEAAIVLGLPVERVLSLVTVGLLKKGLVDEKTATPLALEVKPELRGARGERLAAAARLGKVVHDWEHGFLDEVAKGGPVRELDFSAALQGLIQHAAKRLGGFDLDATREYYRGVVTRAWKQAEGVHTRASFTSQAGRDLEWLMLDDDWHDRLRRRERSGHVLVPWWHRPAAGGGAAVGAGRSGASRPGPAPPAPGGRTSLGEVASSFTGWAEKASSDLLGAFSPAKIEVAPGRPLVDFAAFDKSLGEVLAEMSKNSGGGGGGGGGCACACAGCACACACAGGGR
jgi:hypothetical protein